MHERAARAIEELYRDRLEEHYGDLAHHYCRSGNIEKAVEYLKLAGQQAAQRSANAEAVNHLSTALELLKALPNTLERAQQELVVQTTLGPALSNTKGPAAPEVLHAYARARELCQQVGETPQRFQVLRGLWYFYLHRVELQTARELGEQLLTLAQHVGDPALLLEAHYALGNTLNYLGEFAAARAHFEQGIALYDRQQHRAHAFRYGQDPGVICHAYAALTLWWLGYPEQALTAESPGRNPGPGASPPLQPGHRPGLCSLAPSVAPSRAPDPGVGRRSHSTRGRARVYGLARAGDDLSGLGAGRALR